MRTESEVSRGGAARPGRLRQGVVTALVVGCGIAVLGPAQALGSSTGGTSTEVTTGSPGKAKLKDGKAIPPSDAPNRVINAIEAANEIVKGKGYCLGGGHGKWKSKCYDCSGTVSYALHGGRMIDSALPSGAFKKWGQKGKGDWISVYYNSGHMYAVIAGLRLDTSNTEGAGPGWSNEMASKRDYRARHFASL